MSILTTVEAVPSRLLGLYEVLFHLPDGMNKDELAVCSTPPSLKSGSKLFANTLLEARRLEMVQIAGHDVKLSEDARCGGSPHTNHEKHFRQFMKSILFDIDRAKHVKQDDFLMALSWFMTQDPFTPFDFSNAVGDELNDEIDDSNMGTNVASQYGINNISNSQNFLYWARFMGFATFAGIHKASNKPSTCVIPDPYHAIHDVLETVFDSTKSMSIIDFIEKLAGIYPCFETGKARDIINTIPRKRNQDQPHYLSIATSFAIQRLENNRILTLSNVADSRAFHLNLKFRQRPISRITYNRTDK